ncbi:hypothetical protein GNF10_33740 [Nostoc sp. UCD121]|nr:MULTISPECIES: hypothetical protein [unclassified Nostoc]MBC1224859.1 hypothetical protein [Nostoc sp. UCD120]MBC1280772.1 hypothetical protein [Nostoc sp. UCD121]
MFTLRDHQNTSCGSGQVSFGYANSVISGFDIKIVRYRAKGKGGAY